MEGSHNEWAAHFSREYFSRNAQRSNFDVMATQRVVVVGIGQVGSPIVRQLADCRVGTIVMFDGEAIEPSNLTRHVLNDRTWVGSNKALGMQTFLERNVPWVNVVANPRHLDARVSDEQIDAWFAGADLIVITTDRPDAQERLAARAINLDIPAILPGLDETGGGEVFIQMRRGAPCFTCVAGFRNVDRPLRGIPLLNSEASTVVRVAIDAALGVLDPTSIFGQRLLDDNDRFRQFFLIPASSYNVTYPAVRRRADCPVCGRLVGNGDSQPVRTRRPPEWPAGQASPEERAGGSVTGLRPSRDPRVVLRLGVVIFFALVLASRVMSDLGVPPDSLFAAELPLAMAPIAWLTAEWIHRLVRRGVPWMIAIRRAGLAAVATVVFVAVCVVAIESDRASVRERLSSVDSQAAAQRERVLRQARGSPPADNLLITPTSIGKVRFEMTLADVEAMWGPSLQQKVASDGSACNHVFRSYRVDGTLVGLLYKGSCSLSGTEEDPSVDTTNFKVEGFSTTGLRYRDHYGRGVGDPLSKVAAAYRFPCWDSYTQLGPEGPCWGYAGNYNSALFMAPADETTNEDLDPNDFGPYLAFVGDPVKRVSGGYASNYCMRPFSPELDVPYPDRDCEED